MFKCPACLSRMIWNSDYDLSDTSNKEEKGVVSVYSCSNDDCGSEFIYVQKEVEVH